MRREVGERREYCEEGERREGYVHMYCEVWYTHTCT